MKQRPSVTGVGLTKIFQVLALVALTKLVAITYLWTIPQTTASEALKPLVVSTALAAPQDSEPDLSPETPPETLNTTQGTPATDLLTREKELQRREAEIKALELELDEKIENLQALERKMQALIDTANTLQDEKMQHLVDVYSNMKPKQAAQVLETLDGSIAVQILAGMSGRKAGEILSFVRADIAAYLSEALTRLQTKDATP